MGFRRHCLMETLISIWDNDIGVTRGFSTPESPGGIGSCTGEYGRAMRSMRPKQVQAPGPAT